MKRIRIPLAAIAISLMTACSSDDTNPEVSAPTNFTGEKVAMGSGQVWSVVNTDEDGNPTSLGIAFNASAMENLPTGGAHAHEFMIQLPEQIAVAPYDHLTVDWNEHGHEPPGVYDIAHFDLHFYMISNEERDLITPESTDGFNAPLASDYLPPMYLETPGGVPRMGAHIIDLLSPEIAGTGTFTHTFIFGKFDGEINFLEPMITRDFLETKTPVSKEIRQPAQWQKPGYYPQRYTVSYDAQTEIYTVLLSDLYQSE